MLEIEVIKIKIFYRLIHSIEYELCGPYRESECDYREHDGRNANLFFRLAAMLQILPRVPQSERWQEEAYSIDDCLGRERCRGWRFVKFFPASGAEIYPYSLRGIGAHFWRERRGTMRTGRRVHIFILSCPAILGARGIGQLSWERLTYHP